MLTLIKTFVFIEFLTLLIGSGLLVGAGVLSSIKEFTILNMLLCMVCTILGLFYIILVALLSSTSKEVLLEYNQHVTHLYHKLTYSKFFALSLYPSDEGLATQYRYRIFLNEYGPYYNIPLNISRAEVSKFFNMSASVKSVSEEYYKGNRVFTFLLETDQPGYVSSPSIQAEFENKFLDYLSDLTFSRDLDTIVISQDKE